MAYKSYIFPYTSLDVFYAACCNFMIAAGWTLHDDVSAGEKVYKTQGESGTRPICYLWLKKNGTSNVQIRPYLYWNATTHTGGPYAYSSTYYLSIPTVTEMVMLCGDKDLVYLASRWNTTSGNYSCICGYFPNALSERYTTLTDDVSAGSSVSIPVASSAMFAASTYAQIVGVSSEGRDKLTISSVPDATHIVVSSLPRDYGTGALIGFLPHSGGIAFELTNFYCVAHYNDVGLTTGNNIYYLTDLLGSYGNPHPLSGKRQMSPVLLYTSGVALGVARNTGPLYCNATTADILFVMDDNSYPTTSSVTSATSSTITDSTKSWTPDALIGKYLVISNGTGVGQVKKITDNDATTLTMENDFATAPDATSEYKIVDGVYLYGRTGAFKVVETTVPPTP